MRNYNKLLTILIVILFIWCISLSINRSNQNKQTKNEEIINQYNVSGFSTDFTKIVEENENSIVTVNADNEISSGFVYKQDGDSVYIVCTYHGVANSNNIYVIFGTTYTSPAYLIGHDIYTDIAILRIDSPYLIESLKLADSSLLDKGEFVISIGTPLSLDYAASVELGMISNNINMIENTISVEDERYTYYLNVVELSSNLLKGYSGSPVLNMNGEVIGMNTMSLSNDFNFAVTSNEIKIVADKLINQEEVIRNDLGIKVTFLSEMDNYEKANLGIDLETINGMYVNRVKENSLAFNSGVRNGDVITKINDTEISSINDYLSVIYSDAESFRFTYRRNSETLEAEAIND